MLPPPKQALPQGKAMPKPVVLKPLEVDSDGRIETFAFEREGGGEDDEPVAMDFSRKPATGAVEIKKEDSKIVKPLDWKLKSAVPEKKDPVIMDFFGMGELNSSFPSQFSLFLLSSSHANSSVLINLHLGSSTPSASTSKLSPPTASSSAPSSSFSITASAPVVPVFVPPEPTTTDAYPGYYLHPKTKEWAAYEPEYYNSFWTAWKEEEKRSQEGKQGKGWKGLDTGMGEVAEFSVADQGLGAGGSGLMGQAAAKIEVSRVVPLETRFGRDLCFELFADLRSPCILVFADSHQQSKPKDHRNTLSGTSFRRSSRTYVLRLIARVCVALERASSIDISTHHRV